MSHAVNKKAFSNGSKSVEDEKKSFLNHFNLSKKRVEMTLVFDVWIRIRVFKTPCVINIIIYLDIQKRTF